MYPREDKTWWIGVLTDGIGSSDGSDSFHCHREIELGSFVFQGTLTQPLQMRKHLQSGKKTKWNFHFKCRTHLFE